MPGVLTIRVSAAEMAKMDRRAAELGCDRSGYVRGLIDQDLKAARAPRKHVFASQDLVGCVSTGIIRGDNRTTRKIIRSRLHGRYAKNS